MLCFKGSLKKMGYIVGIIGLCYRMALISFLLTVILRMAENTPDLYETMLNTVLGYFSLSLIPNLVFFVGIWMNIQYFLLPYVAIEGLEIIMEAIFSISGTIMLVEMDWQVYIAAFVPIAIFVLGISIYCWMCLILLYNQMERRTKVINNVEVEKQAPLETIS